MNLRDLIQQQFSLSFPADDFKKLKPTLVDFIEACMQRAEVEGPVSDKIRAMRSEQAKFFRTRSRDAMDKSKDLEREIDSLLAPKRPSIQQQNLF
jgi:hypothetical protein